MNETIRKAMYIGWGLSIACTAARATALIELARIHLLDAGILEILAVMAIWALLLCAAVGMAGLLGEVITRIVRKRRTGRYGYVREGGSGKYGN